MTASPSPAGSHAERLLSVLPDSTAANTPRARVLVIDRGRAFADELQRELAAAAFTIQTASTVNGARQLLANHDIQAVVCDPGVAGERARRFLELLLEYTEFMGVSVTVLSSDPGTIAQKDCLALGADGYFAKPASAATVAALVRNQVRHRIRRHEQVLEDPISGLPSLAFFRGTFERTSQLSLREREPLALVVLHLDSLREARIRSGTVLADAALRHLAMTLTDLLRKSDMVARLHGDSFVIMLPNTNRSGAERVLEKIFHRFQRERVPSSDDHSFLLHFSAGIVEGPSPRETFEDLVQQAIGGLQPVTSTEEWTVRAAVNAPSRSKPKVLLAEDDPVTASIVRHRLEQADMEVLHVDNGAAALSLAPKAKVSLIILDVKMPQLDGFETLRRLRSIRQLRQVPIILLTSMGSEDDVVRGLELGADDYIVKPFSPVELIARARRRLKDRAHPATELPSSAASVA